MDGNSCPVCDKEFDVDDFQRLQPGFVNVWKNYLEECTEKRKRQEILRRHFERSVNTSTSSSSFWSSSNGTDSSSSQNRIETEVAQEIIASQPRRKIAKHVCKYSPMFIDGKCEICFREHLECNLMKGACYICHRPSEECPQEESKSYYITNILSKLYEEFETAKQDFLSGSLTRSSAAGIITMRREHRPLKVIIFSQFRQILNVVGDRLIHKYGGGCISEYWGTYRRHEMQKFERNEECFVMLLSKDGSHGLDLSFVTHIFFLDEIWDRSLEQQVVSRAYRMGAKGSVTVQKLVSKDTIEEILHSMTSSTNESSRSASKQDSNNCTDLDGQVKLHFLLKKTSFIRSSSVSTIATAGSATKKRDAPYKESRTEKKPRVRFS